MNRVPPHDLDAEASVLGAILASAETVLPRIAEDLRPQDFHRPSHRLVYAKALEMFSLGQPVDALTVAAALGPELEAAGGKLYLSELLDSYSTASAAPKHARIVIDLAQRRRLVEAADAVAEIGYSGGDIAEAEYRVLSVVREVDRPVPLPQAIASDMTSFEQAAEGKVTYAGLPISSFPTLEEYLNGFQDERLYVLGGRPGHGKSALLLRFAADICRAGRSVLFVTLEMSAQECRKRLYAQESELSARNIERGNLDGDGWTKLQRAGAGIASWKLEIREPASCDVNQLGAMARRTAPDAIVLDYVQLLAPRNSRDTRFEQVSDSVRALKTLARKLKVPVITGAQLNREIENRPEPRPRLSDLRETGELEQSADVVTFVYWPYASRPTADEFNPHKSEQALIKREEVELLLTKNRNGPANRKVHCRFLADRTLHYERPSKEG